MLDISKDIHSVSAFKRDTATFAAKMKKTGRPVVLTVNGEAAMVVQDAAAYQRLLDQLAEAEKAEMKAFLDESFADIDAGRTVDALEFLANLGKKVRYRLQVSRRATAEIETHYQWLALRDREAAERWREKLFAAIAGLAEMPERYAPAAETEWCERNVREMYFGRRGSMWRVVFEIQDRVIYVARVRHGRQDLLQPGDI